MFGKNKKKSNAQNIFLFGMVLGIAVFAIIISLALVAKIENGNKSSFNKYSNNSKIVKEKISSNTQSVSTPPANEFDRPPATAGVFAGKVKENKNAKIIVEVFDDFECPFCLRHTNTISQMLDEYGDQVNLVLKHFPLTSIHSNAQKAAEAYECAKEQGKAWEMHDKLFEAQVDKNMSLTTYQEDAASLGLDTDKFNSCLDNGKYADRISQDQAEGRQKGVRSIPVTFVNGEIIKGAVSYYTLKAVIDKNL